MTGFIKLMIAEIKKQLDAGDYFSLRRALALLESLVSIDGTNDYERTRAERDLERERKRVNRCGR